MDVERGTDEDVDEVVNAEDEPRERNEHDDHARDAESLARRFTVEDECQATPDHRRSECVATRKPWTVGSRNVREHSREC